MARRPGIDARIRAAEALKHAATGPATHAAVRQALHDTSSLIVAAGARAAQAHRYADLLPDLLAALDHAYVDPIHHDPQCHAKLAIADALMAFDHDDAGLWLRAARHVQPEPVWGGHRDSATTLRIRGAEALARLGHHALFALLADLLADREAEVRSAAARLAGELGGERAAVLLRLRLQLPDAEPDNLGDYAAALLSAAGAEAIPLVASLLRHAVHGGTAALALGASRLPEALPHLVARLADVYDPDARHDLITAIAVHRSEAAAEVLLDLLDGSSDSDRTAAAQGLRLYRDRPAVLQRAQAIAARRRIVLPTEG